MRVSIDPDDVGYIPPQEWGRTFVYLNGETIRDAITADEEAGLIIRTERDSNGRVRHDGQNYIRETLVGQVAIEISAVYAPDEASLQAD